MACATFDESPKAPCLSGTRVDTLQGLVADLKGDQFRLVWLKGSPGRGKSAIAKSVCIELRSDKIPVISFFFNKDGSQAHTASTEIFASTIARQLARYSSEFNSLLASLDLDQVVHSHSKEQQLEQLVIAPACQVEWRSRVVIVLDALDECGDRQALKELMELVQKLLQLPPVFSILISCRPVDVIHNFMKGVLTKQRSLDDTDATGDIRIFVRSILSSITDESGSGKWPPKVSKMDQFANVCGGLFEIASVRIRQLLHQDSVPLIEMFDLFLSYPHDPTPSLVTEYRRILKSAYTDKLVSNEGTRGHQIAYHRYRQFVSLLITAFEPLSPLSLASLANMKVYQVRDSLKQLSPVMEIGGDSDPFRFYHASFREFLLSNEPPSTLYPVSFNGPQHVETLEQCLKNFQISVYGKTMWPRHLAATTNNESLRVVAILGLFSKEDLFRWLECVSAHDASR